jgi:hypothetical protein
VKRESPLNVISIHTRFLLLLVLLQLFQRKNRKKEREETEEKEAIPPSFKNEEVERHKGNEQY